MQLAASSQRTGFALMSLIVATTGAARGSSLPRIPKLDVRASREMSLWL
jgi:hypothetical protein